MDTNATATDAEEKNPMRSTRLGLIVFALVLATHTGTAVAQTSEPKVPEGWRFELPAGDADDGKAVFMKMRCFTCHAVRVPGEPAPADMGDVGPALGSGYAKLPAEYLAESIMKAHAVVAAPGYRPREDVAGMGNYNYFLTVQELLDLVAFLKSLPVSE